MKKLYTEIEINADVQTVWKHLTNFETYAEWNPFIKFLEGEPVIGRVLKVQMDLDGKIQIFKPEVLAVDVNKEFRWKGKLWVKGLFDGEHFFKLEALSPGKTRLVQGEVFTGILSGFILKMIGETTVQKFKKMNEALKKRCENKMAYSEN